MTSINGEEYTYDRNGNMAVTPEGQRYHWDYNNRLVAVDTATGTSSYTYDTNGQRVSSVTPSSATYFPSQTYSTDGTTPDKHIFLGDTAIATVRGTDKDAVPYSIQTDHLTGSNITTDASGNLAELTDYYAFGTMRIDSQTGNFTEKRKFTGHEYDADTGLTYANARYYDARIGRWISEDPLSIRFFDEKTIKTITSQDYDKFLSNPQALNAYAYVSNNPLKYIDPLGFWQQKDGKVEKGDTLNKITTQINKLYGTNYSVQDIAKLNSINDPSKISTGQIVKPYDAVPDISVDLTDKMHQDAKDAKIQNPFYFKDKVKKGGEWDLKSQPGIYCTRQSCGGMQHESYVFRGEEISYDAPGNILYGYVGSNTWYGDPAVLHYFAGRAQNADNHTRSGDTPSDSRYIQKGIDLYNFSY